MPDSAPSSRLYINNYIDFELYKELYSPTFEDDGDRIVEQFARSLKRTNKSVVIDDSDDLTQPSARHKASSARLNTIRGTGKRAIDGDIQNRHAHKRRRMRPVLQSDSDNA